MGIRITIAPPFASQGKAPHCWAACTTSWLAVNKDRPQLNLKQLVDRYGDPKKDGGISFQDEKYERLRSDLRWTNSSHVDVVLRLGPSRGGRKQLTLPGFAKEVEDALFRRGYLLLVDNHTPGSIISEGVSHMYVVYGVVDLRSGGHELLVMDPSSSSRKRLSVAAFVDHHIALLGTYEEITVERAKSIKFADALE